MFTGGHMNLQYFNFTRIQQSWNLFLGGLIIINLRPLVGSRATRTRRRRPDTPPRDRGGLGYHACLRGRCIVRPLTRGSGTSSRQHARSPWLGDAHLQRCRWLHTSSGARNQPATLRWLGPRRRPWSPVGHIPGRRPIWTPRSRAPLPAAIPPPLPLWFILFYVSTQCFHACWHVYLIHISHAHSAWLKTSSKPRSVKRECSSHFLSAGVCIGFQGSLKGESYLKVVAEPVPSPSLDPCAELPFSAYIPYIGLAEATCRSS